jgi:hypothetical protein
MFWSLGAGFFSSLEADMQQTRDMHSPVWLWDVKTWTSESS